MTTSAGRQGNRTRTAAAASPAASASATAIPRQVTCHNHQRDCPVDLRQFRRLAAALLDDVLALPGYALEVSLLDDPGMARVNEQFVHHAGPTDVITFDYSEPEAACRQGEILLCPAEALRQAGRFRTTWQSELARYFIHGVLHLLGHDDLAPDPRRRMKRLEHRLLRELAARFPLNRLTRLAPSRP